MTVQQPIQTQRAPESGVAAPLIDEELSRVKALLGRLEESGGSTEIATSFNRSIAGLARHRTRQVFEFLHELAELPVLRRAKDRNDWPCRAAVLSTWLELGYPFALELTPEDLDYVREHAPSGGTGWLNATSVLATISGLINVSVTLLLIVVLMAQSLGELAFVLPTALMSLHAIALLSGLQRRATRGTWLRRLGAVGLIAPIGAALVTLLAGAAGDAVTTALSAFLFVGCLPMGLASVSALVAASSSKKLGP